MNELEKLTLTKAMLDITGSEYDSALTVYLSLAEQKILGTAFPYDSTQSQTPERYEFLQCQIAAYLWAKRGAEGQTSHTENGVSRAYENADVPASMLKAITPYCGVIT